MKNIKLVSVNCSESRVVAEKIQECCSAGFIGEPVIGSAAFNELDEHLLDPLWSIGPHQLKVFGKYE